MAVERKKKKREEREKVNDYSGTIVSERRRWRTHTLGPKVMPERHQWHTHTLGPKVSEYSDTIVSERQWWWIHNSHARTQIFLQWFPNKTWLFVYWSALAPTPAQLSSAPAGAKEAIISMEFVVAVLSPTINLPLLGTPGLWNLAYIQEANIRYKMLFQPN